MEAQKFQKQHRQGINRHRQGLIGTIGATTSDFGSGPAD